MMTKEDIFLTLKQNIVSVLPAVSPEVISTEKHLKDLGANSIDRVEIITMTLEDIKLELPLIELGQAKGIGELVNLLYERKNYH